MTESFLSLSTTWSEEEPEIPEDPEAENEGQLQVLDDDAVNEERETTLYIPDSDESGGSGFCYGDQAGFLVICSDFSIPYTIETSWGTARRTDSAFLYLIDERIIFAKSKEASIRHQRFGPVEWNWFGKQGPVPLFQDDRILLTSEFTGIMDITYLTLAHRWVVTAPVYRSPVSGSIVSPMPVLVVALQGKRTASIEFSFGLCEAQSDGTELPVPVRVRIEGVCSGEAIPGAIVRVNGQAFTATTGEIEIGEFQRGTRLTVSASAEGYLPSNTQTHTVENIDRTLTRAKYDQLINDMSYSRVVEIIGFEGTKTEFSSTSIMYKWTEKGGKSITVRFENDRLVEKTQKGL